MDGNADRDDVQTSPFGSDFTVDAGGYRFDNGIASGFATMAPDGTAIAIHEFQTHVAKTGAARSTLRDFKRRFGHVTVVDPGAPDSGSFSFWAKMAEEGQVDRIETEDQEAFYADGVWDEDLIASFDVERSPSF